MNGAQAIISCLEKAGATHLFGYPGGCIMPLYDALLDTDLVHVLCRHEQAAALAAEGFARASGKLGVCIATSGPGATNLITGVANAYMDSVPILVITGQVPTHLIGTDAFQETDILGMTLGIVKHSYLVSDANDLPTIINEAMDIATHGRPGPVWIDIPKDVLLQECFEDTLKSSSRLDQAFSPSPPISSTCHEQIEKACTLIKSAKRPILYSGGGVTAAKAETCLLSFAKSMEIPQVTSLKGIGNAGDQTDLCLGMIGMHGSQAANQAVHECDLLIAVGVRFDDRATGKVADFAPNAKIIHLDYDASELNKLKQVDCALKGDLHYLLGQLMSSVGEIRNTSDWQDYCKKLNTTKGFLPTLDPDNQGAIEGPEFFFLLSTLKPNNSIVCCDVGQHQMWAAQYMQFDHPRKHLSSGGLGTMGFGLPAAIGAQFAQLDQPVINISGDGSFMMNIQELATVCRYRLPVKMIVIDNQKLGMVRQQQELFYQQRYSEIDLSDNPEFCSIAKVFGIHSLKIDQRHQMRRGIETLFAYPGSALLHVQIQEETNVWPIVKPGCSNREMINPKFHRTHTMKEVSENA